MKIVTLTGTTTRFRPTGRGVDCGGHDSYYVSYRVAQRLNRAAAPRMAAFQCDRDYQAMAPKRNSAYAVPVVYTD